MAGISPTPLLKVLVNTMSNCLYCGKEFVKKSSTHTFCSSNCRKNYHCEIPSNPTIELTDKICPVCGKSFLSTRFNKKYCSNECSHTAKLERERKRQRKIYVSKPKPKFKKICMICGNEFETHKHNQKYCSNCGYLGVRSKHIKTDPHPKKDTVIKKVCLCCGNEFTPVNKAQKYCSPDCFYKRFKPTYRICKCCGTKFLATSDSQIYCSEYCRLVMREDYTPVIKSPAEKSNLDKLVDEADACGLSYGQYKAQIAMGKTFEELKALHERHLQKRSDIL